MAGSKIDAAIDALLDDRAARVEQIRLLRDSVRLAASYIEELHGRDDMVDLLGDVLSRVT